MIENFGWRAPIWAARQFNREHHPLQVQLVCTAMRRDNNPGGRNSLFQAKTTAGRMAATKSARLNVARSASPLDRKIWTGGSGVETSGLPTAKNSHSRRGTRLFVAVALGGFVGFATARWFH